MVIKNLLLSLCIVLATMPLQGMQAATQQSIRVVHGVQKSTVVVPPASVHKSKNRRSKKRKKHGDRRAIKKVVIIGAVIAGVIVCVCAALPAVVGIGLGGIFVGGAH